MRKFIAFFKRFRVFLVFLFLQIAALTSFFSVMTYPRTKFFNTSSHIIAQLLSFEREITKFIYLDEANQTLQEEYVALNKRVASNYNSIDDRTALIEDTLQELSYEWLPGTVINSSNTFSDNYFTINIGYASGVRPDMGVVSGSGVVGIVYDVSKHYAVVKSILTRNFNVSAYIEGNDAFGLIKYDGEHPKFVQLTGVSNDISLTEGSKIRARGSGGYFPNGIEIGTIEKFEEIEGEPLWNITVMLSQDMRRLRNIYVVKSIFKEELDNLEQNIPPLD